LSNFACYYFVIEPIMTWSIYLLPVMLQAPCNVVGYLNNAGSLSKKRNKKRSKIFSEISVFGEILTNVFQNMTQREKGENFKKAISLTRPKSKDLEEAPCSRNVSRKTGSILFAAFMRMEIVQSGINGLDWLGVKMLCSDKSLRNGFYLSKLNHRALVNNSQSSSS